MSLRNAIECAINTNSAENGSDTPDFILAEYLISCLQAFDRACITRSKWYGLDPHAPHERLGVSDTRLKTDRLRPKTKLRPPLDLPYGTAAALGHLLGRTPQPQGVSESTASKGGVNATPNTLPPERPPQYQGGTIESHVPQE